MGRWNARFSGALGLILSWIWVLPALADAAPQPDWEAIKDVQFVSILTNTPRGDRRDTTIWLVVVDGQGYIRSGNPIRRGGESWVDDLARDPRAILRVRDSDYAVKVVPVADPGLIDQVQGAYREKYGLIDRFIRWARPSLTTIRRLDSDPFDS